jgi:hypothetical protein
MMIDHGWPTMAADELGEVNEHSPLQMDVDYARDRGLSLCIGSAGFAVGVGGGCDGVSAAVNSWRFSAPITTVSREEFAKIATANEGSCLFV